MTGMIAEVVSHPTGTELVYMCSHTQVHLYMRARALTHTQNSPETTKDVADSISPGQP